MASILALTTCALGAVVVLVPRFLPVSRKALDPRAFVEFRESLTDARVVIRGRVLNTELVPAEIHCELVTWNLGSYVNPSGLGRSRYAYNLLSDGSFDADCGHCVAMDMWFYADGYQHERVSATIPAPWEPGTPRPLVGVGQATVRLRRTEGPATLRLSGGTLRSDPLMPWGVLPLSWDKERDFSPLQLRVHERDRRLFVLVKEQAYPPKEREYDAEEFFGPHLFLGRSWGLPLRFDSAPPIPSSTSNEAELFLWASSSSDGFVAHATHQTIASFVYREMKEAPESGYEPRLAMPPEVRDELFFFVKIGNRYGKGRVGRARYGRRGTLPGYASAEAEVLLNDGRDRNLAGDWAFPLAPLLDKPFYERRVPWQWPED